MAIFIIILHCVQTRKQSSEIDSYHHLQNRSCQMSTYSSEIILAIVVVGVSIVVVGLLTRRKAKNGAKTTAKEVKIAPIEQETFS